MATGALMHSIVPSNLYPRVTFILKKLRDAYRTDGIQKNNGDSPLDSNVTQKKIFSTLLLNAFTLCALSQCKATHSGEGSHEQPNAHALEDPNFVRKQYQYLQDTIRFSHCNISPTFLKNNTDQNEIRDPGWLLNIQKDEKENRQLSMC
jgi:hypothetical protein